MSIFQITFNKEIPEGRKNEILDNLISNLSGTYYKNIEKIGNDKLIIEGDFVSRRSTRNSLWNMWSGFSKKAEVSIVNEKIFYTLDYSYAIYSGLIVIVFLFLFIPFTTKLDLGMNFILIFFLLVVVFLAFSIGYRIFLHRNLLVYTLKHGSRFKGEYDWENILKEKTMKELENIAIGNTTLTEEVQELARKELSNRIGKK